MKQYIAITPQSVIHIGAQKPNFSFLPTVDVISGSVIRGALADYMIKQGESSEIKNYIKNLRFGFFSPSNSPLNLPLPFPQTALSCKIEGGFKPKNHGIFDSLIADIAYRELRQNFKAKFPVPFKFNCNNCEKRMDKFSGFYVRESNKYETISPLKHVSQTKVAINRRRKSAEKELLYSITGIKPNIVFVGKITGENDKINLVIDALKEVGIGALTTRGLGKVGAEVTKVTMESLKDRVKIFNEKLLEVWGEVHSIALNKNEIPIEPQDYYFTVDLLSPTILTDNCIPTLKLRIEIVGQILEPIFYITTPIFTGGWSTAWGLPKETTYAADIGGTYVFKVKKESNVMYKTLEDIEERGVGKRTDEGYGDVIICHPFHREVTPV